jgi:hypothetical protein
LKWSKLILKNSQVCYARKQYAESDFDVCGKLNCDGIVIVAKDDQNNETSTIPRASNKTLRALTLSASSLDGAYLWQRRTVNPDGGSPIAFSSTQAAVALVLAKSYGITLIENVISGKFKQLITTLSQTRGKVVILIDEYDKPISNG